MDKKHIIKDQFAQTMNYIGISMIWLLVSAAGFLLSMGAATTAAFHTVHKVMDKGRNTKLIATFVKSFTENVVVSTMIYLVSVSLGLGLFFIYNYAINTDQTWLVVMVYISAIELILFNLYVYPLIAVFQHPSVFVLIKNTILMSHFHFFTTLKLIGSLAIFVFLIVRVHPALFILAISIFFFLAMFHLNTIFTRYIEQTKEERPNEELS